MHGNEVRVRLKRTISRRLRSRVGVSTVVATVLTMLIVTVAGVAILGVGVNYLGQTTTVFDTLTGTQQRKIKERFIVDDAWFYPGNNTVKVSVYNYGKAAIEVVAVLVNDTYNTISPAVTVETNEHVWLSFTPNASVVPIVDGRTYLVDVVTFRGNRYSTYWEA